MGYLGDIFQISLGYLGETFGISLGYLGDISGISSRSSMSSMVHWSIGPVVHWSIGPLVPWSFGPLVECQMSKFNMVKLLSERTSGVPPVIFSTVDTQR